MSKTTENRNAIEQICKEIKAPHFYAAYREQCDNPSYAEMSFDQRLLCLLTAEKQARSYKRQQRFIKNARLPLYQMAQFEKIDWDPRRGLNRQLFEELCDCNWLEAERKPWVTISGMAGVGKSFLGCILTYQACLHGITSLYYRLPELISDIEAAKRNHSIIEFRNMLKTKHLLTIDEFGAETMSQEMVSEFLTLLEQRLGERSLIIIGQMPLKDWHRYLGDPIKADAIMDRITYQSYHITLKGPSMRSKYAAAKEENIS